MGGKGSGRKADPLKQFTPQRTNIVSVGTQPLELPNYSGMQKKLDDGETTVKLNKVENPDASKTFNLGNNKFLTFSSVDRTPIAGEGTFNFETSGNFTGDLVHIHQHTGNAGADTNLLSIESEDSDATCLSVEANAAGDNAIDVVTGNIDLTNTTTNHILLPSLNDAATPTLAFGDGDTGFYEKQDDILLLGLGNSQRYQFSSTMFRFPSNNYFGVRIILPTATTPVFLPNNIDLDTGIGRAAADQLSMIAGGVEGIRISEATGDITVDIPGIVDIKNDKAIVLNDNKLYLDDGTNYYLEKQSSTFMMRMAGFDTWRFATNQFGPAQSTMPALQNTAPTATSPSILPGRNDSNTGIGRAGTDEFSLIAGGIEGQRIKGAGGAVTTRFANKVYIGNTTTLPSEALEVAGTISGPDINFSGTLSGPNIQNTGDHTLSGPIAFSTGIITHTSPAPPTASNYPQGTIYLQYTA